jgi:hypothetical protein
VKPACISGIKKGISERQEKRNAYRILLRKPE